MRIHGDLLTSACTNSVHTHNATLFLPSILPLLKPRSRAMLLQAHLRASLVFWVAQGRPAFEIEKTLNAGPKSLDVDGDVMGDDGKCLVQQEGWNAVSTVGAHHLDEVSDAPNLPTLSLADTHIHYLTAHVQGRPCASLVRCPSLNYSSRCTHSPA